MVEITVHKGMYMVGIMLMRVQMMTHVETIALLQKINHNSKAKAYVNVGIDAEEYYAIKSASSKLSNTYINVFDPS